MENILPFEITNEMAVLIGLLGPVVGKACIKKSSQIVSKAKDLALFRGITAWKRERRYSHLKNCAGHEVYFLWCTIKYHNPIHI